MRMMTHSSGAIIAAGFDMRQRKGDPFVISCSDHDGVSWEPLVGNKAETIKLPEPIDPEAMIELDDKVLLIQPRKIVVLTPQESGPWVWLVTIMRPDTPHPQLDDAIHEIRPSIGRRSRPFEETQEAIREEEADQELRDGLDKFRSTPGYGPSQPASDPFKALPRGR